MGASTLLARSLAVEMDNSDTHTKAQVSESMEAIQSKTYLFSIFNFTWIRGNVSGAGNSRSFGLLKVFKCKILCRPVFGSFGKILFPKFLLQMKRNENFHLNPKTLRSINLQIF